MVCRTIPFRNPIGLLLMSKTEQNEEILSSNAEDKISPWLGQRKTGHDV